mgnify:CR=1 FL=1
MCVSLFMVGCQGVDGIPFLFTLHVTGWESSSLQKLWGFPVVKTYSSDFARVAPT